MRESTYELLTELADWFDARADITADGGPNAAMSWHRRVTDALVDDPLDVAVVAARQLALLKFDVLPFPVGTLP